MSRTRILYNRDGSHKAVYKDGVLVGGTLLDSPPDVGDSAPYVIGDIEPYRSPIDGTTILGRRGLREHCKAHGVVLAEDLKGLPPAKSFDPDAVVRDSKKSLKQDLIRAYNELDNRRRK